MTSLIGTLKFSLAGWMVASYALRSPLRRDLSILGTGREQIVCTSRGSTEVVKILIESTARSSTQLRAALEEIERQTDVLESELGPYCAPTRYSIGNVDRRSRAWCVIGRQERHDIVDAVFRHTGGLTDRGSALSSDMSSDIAARIQSYFHRTGNMVDVLGIGNFVFVGGREAPLLIDTIPIEPRILGLPSKVGDRTILTEIEDRLSMLAAHRRPETGDVMRGDDPTS
jgi:hypothetical protein